MFFMSDIVLLYPSSNNLYISLVEFNDFFP